SALDTNAGEVVLVPTFRLPVLVHTRTGNAKWLNEIAHANPLWIHTADAAKLGIELGDLLRVTTEIGYFVVPAWVTEGIRPGVLAPHGPLARRRRHGHGSMELRARASGRGRQRALAHASRQRRRGVRQRRPRFRPSVVAECGRPSEPHIPGAPRSDQRRARMA